MYVKPIPPCQRCLGSQKEHGEHETWEDCQAEMAREDLRCPARRHRPRSGTIKKAWTGDVREYA